MITHIICDRIFMRCFEKTQTGYLVKVFSLLFHHYGQFLFAKAVGAHQLNKIILREGLEGTAVVLTVAWLGQIDRLVAVPGLIVITFTLCTVGVPNIVRVILLKLVVVDVGLLCHLLFPIAQRLFHRQAHALQEETQLQTTIVLEVVLLLKDLVQRFHAGRERLPCVVVQVPQTHSVAVSRRLHLKNVEVYGVMVGESQQHTLDARILQYRRQVLVSLHELQTQLRSEVGRRDRLQLADRHVGNTL